MADSSPRRKLAVILATDVVGYSTKMEENEDQTLILTTRSATSSPVSAPTNPSQSDTLFL